MAARVVVVGTGLGAETAARYLAGAGIGTLRLDATFAEKPGFLTGLRGSQPGVRVDLMAASREAAPKGAFELAALAGASLLLKEGFDDDAWLGAAVRLGVPAIFARSSAGDEGEPVVEVLSFRRHGPCPHVPLDRPTASAPTSLREVETGDAVAAGALAAAEALRLLGARGRGDTELSAARHVRLPLGQGAPRVQDIPWSPACFACGGQGAEMTFI